MPPLEPAAAAGTPISRRQLALLVEQQVSEDPVRLWQGLAPDHRLLRRRELCRVLHRLWLRRL
jgi:hypothetical protein